VAEGAIAMNHCGRVRLEILADGVVSLAQEMALSQHAVILLGF
jgi:hypothetical protein